MATLKNTTVNGTDALTLPIGTTAQRPVAANGQFRYNSSTSSLEVYTAGSWLGSPGTIANPAVNAAAIRTVNASAADGNYYYKPTNYTGIPIQCYTNFTNAPSGKGYVQVARGRESTDWWNTNGQNQLGLIDTTTNTPIAVAPDLFVNTLIGSNWNLMKMLTNRMNIPDSLYIQGTSSTSFSWAYFNAVPSSVNATITRYTSTWKGGTASYTGTNINTWTDTLTAGLASNDCTRTFTWTWASHGGFQGWSGGSTCTPAGSYQYTTEGHAINLVNVYIEC